MSIVISLYNEVDNYVLPTNKQPFDFCFLRVLERQMAQLHNYTSVFKRFYMYGEYWSMSEREGAYINLH